MDDAEQPSLPASPRAVANVPKAACQCKTELGSADNELRWVSASQPGSSRVFNQPIEIGTKPVIIGLLFFGGHNLKTTEQTRVLSWSDVYFSCNSSAALAAALVALATTQ